MERKLFEGTDPRPFFPIIELTEDGVVPSEYHVASESLMVKNIMLQATVERLSNELSKKQEV